MAKREDNQNESNTKMDIDEETIPEIEYWHENLKDWDVDWNMPNPDLFFKTHVGHFWQFLDLMEIVNLSFLYKNAAYTAYQYNYAKFRTFCNKVWYDDILDFSFFGSLTIENFNLIQTMFKANTMIFTDALPFNFLNHIYIGSKYIFYPRAGYNPITRPFSDCCREDGKKLDITVIGLNLLPSSDQVIDILATFNVIGKLELHGIPINKLIVNILNGISFNRIKLKNVTISCEQEDLRMLFFNSYNELKQMHLEYVQVRNPMFRIIDLILGNLLFFKCLRVLTISMELTQKNVARLLNVMFPDTMIRLNIVVVPNPEKRRLPYGVFLKKLNSIKNVKIFIRPYKMDYDGFSF